MQHVLVAEDDEAICDIIEFYLGSEGGYRTTHAFTGDTAVEALRQQPRPDIVIVDLLLPRLSGVEVARVAAECEVPALLMSGAPGQIARLREFECPYLEKPFRMAELGEQLRILLDQREKALAQIRLALEGLSENRTALAGVLSDAENTLAKSRQERALRLSREQQRK